MVDSVAGWAVLILVGSPVYVQFYSDTDGVMDK